MWGQSACRCRSPGSTGRRQGALMRQWRLIHLVPLCMGRAKAGFPALTPEQGTASWTRWRCCRRAKAIPVLLGVPNWDCTVPPSYCWTGSSARPRTGTASLLVSEYYRTFADMCNAIITYYRTVRFKLDIARYASRNPKLFCTKLMIGAIDTPVCSKNLLFEGLFSKFGRRPARPFCMASPNCAEQFHTNAQWGPKQSDHLEPIT